MATVTFMARVEPEDVAQGLNAIAFKAEEHPNFALTTKALDAFIGLLFFVRQEPLELIVMDRPGDDMDLGEHGAFGS